MIVFWFPEACLKKDVIFTSLEGSRNILMNKLVKLKADLFSKKVSISFSLELILDGINLCLIHDYYIFRGVFRIQMNIYEGSSFAELVFSG